MENFQLTLFFVLSFVIWQHEFRDVSLRQNCKLPVLIYRLSDIYLRHKTMICTVLVLELRTGLAWLITSVKWVMILFLSVCLLTGLLKNYWAKLYEIFGKVGHNPATDWLDFDWPWPNWFRRSEGQNHFSQVISSE